MKACRWGPGTLKAMRDMPKDVRLAFGHALHIASLGGRADGVKPMKGLGVGVLEVVEDHDGNTYRAVYTARLESGVYVLHVFQKKSKSGISTPREDIDLIKERFKWAMQEDRRVKR
jgi:phage-related protein